MNTFQDAEFSRTLVVYSNGSDEVFVANKQSGVVIRISDYGKDLIITNHGYIITPSSKNGFPAMRVYKHPGDTK